MDLHYKQEVTVGALVLVGVDRGDHRRDQLGRDVDHDQDRERGASRLVDDAVYEEERLLAVVNNVLGTGTVAPVAPGLHKDTQESAAPF